MANFAVVMRKSHNRLLMLSLSVLLATAALAYTLGVWQVSRLNNSLQPQPVESNMLVRFKLDPECTVRSGAGSRVFFDMGSRHSFISSAELERLEKIGYPFQVESCLMITTDPSGRYKLYTRKVVMDIGLPNAELPGGYFHLRNADLLVSDRADDNIFGMDILRRFVIERTWESNEMRLYKNVPEGYVRVCDINVYDAELGNLLSPSLRASIMLTVNNDEPREYFFDTGGEMRSYELVQPRSNADYALSSLKTDSITGYLIQPRCYVTFGDRLRYSSVVYCDTLHTDKYSVNPLRLFDQDMVLDMPGRQMLVHKTRNDQ